MTSTPDGRRVSTGCIRKVLPAVRPCHSRHRVCGSVLILHSRVRYLDFRYWTDTHREDAMKLNGLPVAFIAAALAAPALAQEGPIRGGSEKFKLSLGTILNESDTSVRI